MSDEHESFDFFVVWEGGSCNQGDCDCGSAVYGSLKDAMAFASTKRGFGMSVIVIKGIKVEEFMN